MTMTITYKEMTGVPKHGIRTKLRQGVLTTMTFLAGNATVKAESNPGQKLTLVDSRLKINKICCTNNEFQLGYRFMAVSTEKVPF